MRLHRWLGLGLLLAILPTQLVLAHPKIITTDPPADAQLEQSPEYVRIEFNEAIEQTFAELQVLNAEGQPVDLGDGGRSANNPAVLSVSLPQLPAGIYTVIWQVVGSDGHQVKGFFAFRVLGQANQQTPTVVAPGPTSQIAPTTIAVPPPTIPVEQPEPPIGWGAFLRTCMLLGSLLALGGWAFLGLILGPLRMTHAEIYQIAMVRIRRVLLAGLIVLLLTLPLFLIFHTSTIADRIDLPNLWLTLTATRLGQALLVRALAASLLLVLLLTHPHPDQFPTPLLLLGSVLLLTFTVSGHASTGANPLLPLVFDWLHLTATTIWIGGLITFTLVLPLLSPLIGAVVVRFSRMALVCVAILAVSGVYAATLHLTTFSDLWTSAYGWALTLKLILFGITLILGAYHLFGARTQTLTRITDATTAFTNWQQRFNISLKIEAVTAILIIGVVGLLTSLPLPDAQPATAAPIIAQSATPAQIELAATAVLPTGTPAPIVPFVEEQQAADLRVQLRVEPAVLGANTMDVTVLDVAGNPRDVQRVQMTLEMTTMDMGVTSVIAEPQGNGAYQVQAQWLSMVGTWRIQVVVRRSDAEDVTVMFMVPVVESR